MDILQIIYKFLPSAFVGVIFVLIILQSRKIDRLETEIRILRIKVDKALDALERKNGANG